MSSSRKKSATSTARQPSAGKRSYLSQSDVPGHSLADAIRVPRAISDEYGKRPTPPLDVARALRVLPTSGGFRSLTGAALAYGLTDGGPGAKLIGIKELGLRIVSPAEEGDDLAAKREALMRPRVVREFLEKYDGSKLPSEQIGANVLERMGVPRDATGRTFNLIVSGASDLGLLTEIKGQSYVNLNPTGGRVSAAVVPPAVEHEGADEEAALMSDGQSAAATMPPALLDTRPEVAPREALVKNRKVFISHGSNRKIVEQLKELLTYGDFEPVVSEEKETTARPVPEKVLGDMRGCGAGIIHVGVEQTIVEEDGTEHPLLNYNVLIEIGAAMALYGSNYILLVEQGTKLPSNLQGLYEARYKGDVLDHDATMKLLRTFKQFKS